MSLLDGHCVGFGNNRNDVDCVTQALHELDVQLPKTGADGQSESESGQLVQNNEKMTGATNTAKKHLVFTVSLALLGFEALTKDCF